MRKHLTIIHIISQSRYSGAERICLDLCAELQKRGHRIMLLCKSDGNLPHEAQKRNIETQTPPIFGKINFAAPFIIARIARKLNANIIHSHLSTANLWGSLAGRLAKIKTVGHIHAINTFYYYKYNNINVTCSNGVRRSMLAQGATPEHLRVVYNGILPERFENILSRSKARAMLGLDADSFVIVCVAHLSPRKGQIFLLRAISNLRGRIPKLKCLFLGDGKLDDFLQREAINLCVADCVQFLGFRHDAISVMNSADIATLPSIAKEGLGLVLLEAALLGIPAIASDAPGIDEAIEHGKTGLLVPPGDAAALADAIETLYANKKLRLSMGHAGRERTSRMFALSSMANAFEAIYAELHSA